MTRSWSGPPAPVRPLRRTSLSGRCRIGQWTILAAVPTGAIAPKVGTVPAVLCGLQPGSDRVATVGFPPAKRRQPCERRGGALRRFLGAAHPAWDAACEKDLLAQHCV